MFFVVLVMLLMCIGLPLAFAWRVFRLDEPTLSAWLLSVANAAVIVALVLLLGRWDMAGYYARLLVLAVFLSAVVWSLGKHLPRAWKSRKNLTVQRHGTMLASLVLFGSALAYVVYGTIPPSETRDLTFPLRDGRFMVGQGGGVGLLNRHAGHREQRHAADIGAIGPLGYRAAGLAPASLESYEVFGAAVVSPCDGVVVGSRNDLPDLIPPETDRQNARGNHLIIDCGGFNVELAHLQHGSVSAQVGASVSAGDDIGKVGNSGNTTEPHLHIHAVDRASRTGIAMSFDGRIPLRNRLYVN